MKQPSFKIKNGKLICNNKPIAKINSKRSLKSVLKECKIRHIE